MNNNPLLSGHSSSSEGQLFEGTMMFSALRDRKSLMTLKWKKWQSMNVKISAMGVLVYAKEATPRVVKGTFDVSHSVSITMMEHNVSEEEQENSQQNGGDVGIMVRVKDKNNVEERLRCILTMDDFALFNDALEKVAKVHKLDASLNATLYVHKTEKYYEKESNKNLKASSRAGISVMRRGIMMAMDKTDKRSRKERILAKRGALRWLPIHFRNDLVHGSW